MGLGLGVRVPDKFIARVELLNSLPRGLIDGVVLRGRLRGIGFVIASRDVARSALSVAGSVSAYIRSEDRVKQKSRKYAAAFCILRFTSGVRKMTLSRPQTPGGGLTLEAPLETPAPVRSSMVTQPVAMMNI